MRGGAYCKQEREAPLLWEAVFPTHRYRRGAGSIFTVKRTKTGSWYAVIGGKLWEGRWFKSADEAMRALDYP